MRYMYVCVKELNYLYHSRRNAGAKKTGLAGSFASWLGHTSTSLYEANAALNRVCVNEKSRLRREIFT